MTRPLLLTAAFGFVAAFVCFAIVAALGPIRWDNWSFGDHAYAFGGGHGRHGWRHGDWTSGDGPQTSRDLVFDGTDTLTVDVPATVTYTQGAVAHLTVTGPKGMVDHLVSHGDTLRFDTDVSGGGPLRITLTAPGVKDFVLDGDQDLHIAGYDQDRLGIRLRGSGDVDAKGKARDVVLAIAGSGDADLGGVAAETADVSIAGSGDATVAPTRRAAVRIAGSGDVTLTTNPPQLDTQVLGSGEIIHAAPAAR